MPEHIYKFVWNIFCEILDALDGFYKAIFIIGVLFSIVAVLIIIGHVSGNVVSIGAVDSQEAEKHNLLIITPLAFVLLCIGGLCLIGYCIYRARYKTSTIPPSWKYPNKLTVHVVLPNNKNGYRDTLGDGLLQAAGFLAASDAFKNVTILPYDHENNADKAWEILEGIIETESEKREPICVVFTMSSICSIVFKRCHEKIKKCSPKVRARLSIVFTVASNPTTPYDKQFFFQHFVTGDKEAERIVHHCRSICQTPAHKNCIHRGLLFVMDSPYSDETAKRIKNKLEKYISFDLIPLNSSNQLTGAQVRRILRFVNDTLIYERFAVIVAYDMALLNSIEALNQVGYEGVIIATTTLSVKDWQEYMDKDHYWNPNKTKVFYTRVEGFDPDNTQTTFAISLDSWDFDKVIRQNKKPMEFYKANPDIVKGWFKPEEIEVYKKIYPNYISAFCFDSVRLFSKMKNHTKWTLLKLINECSLQEQNEDSPFSENELFKHGKTIVPIEICPLESKRIES